MKKHLIALLALIVGLSPMANAYRDLETGTFLTRDPIGYADGPNVYCYVHCNPITKFDALGLWKSDVHRNDTKKWSKEVGFSDKQAEIIAKANNGVDSILKGKSFLPIFGRQSYHFNTNKKGESDSRVEHAKKHYNKAVKLWKKAEAQKAKGMEKSAAKTKEKALKELGKALHPVQDIMAHDKANTKKALGFIYYHKKKIEGSDKEVDSKKDREEEHKETEGFTKKILDCFLVETGQKNDDTKSSSGSESGDDQAAQSTSTGSEGSAETEPETSNSG